MGSEPVESSPSLFMKAQSSVLLLLHLLLVSLTVTTLFWVTNEGMSGGGGLTLDSTDVKVFNAHPLCMVMSFVLMTVARLSFLLPYTKTKARTTIKIIHGLSWLIALSSASIGLYAVWSSHNMEGNYLANLYSLHSWMGMSVFTLFLANFVAGTGAFGFKLVSEESRASLMPFHKALGGLIFFTWAFVILLGIQEKEGFYGEGFKCAYTVTEKDTNPISHYFDIPYVCRLSHAVGMQVFGVVIGVSIVGFKE
jgi:cytochrome b-561